MGMCDNCYSTRNSQDLLAWKSILQYIGIFFFSTGKKLNIVVQQESKTEFSQKLYITARKALHHFVQLARLYNIASVSFGRICENNKLQFLACQFWSKN